MESLIGRKTQNSGSLDPQLFYGRNIDFKDFFLPSTIKCVVGFHILRAPQDVIPYFKDYIKYNSRLAQGEAWRYEFNPSLVLTGGVWISLKVSIAEFPLFQRISDP